MICLEGSEIFLTPKIHGGLVKSGQFVNSLMNFITNNVPLQIVLIFYARFMLMKFKKYILSQTGQIVVTSIQMMWK